MATHIPLVGNPVPRDRRLQIPSQRIVIGPKKYPGKESENSSPTALNSSAICESLPAAVNPANNYAGCLGVSPLDGADGHCDKAL